MSYWVRLHANRGPKVASVAEGRSRSRLTGSILFHPTAGTRFAVECQYGWCWIGGSKPPRISADHWETPHFYLHTIRLRTFVHSFTRSFVRWSYAFGDHRLWYHCNSWRRACATLSAIFDWNRIYVYCIRIYIERRVNNKNEEKLKY